MGEIRIVGPGKTRGHPYPVCKKMGVETKKNKKCILTILFHRIRTDLEKSLKMILVLKNTWNS